MLLSKVPTAVNTFLNAIGNVAIPTLASSDVSDLAFPPWLNTDAAPFYF